MPMPRKPWSRKTWANPIDKVNAMVEENVIAQLNNIKTHPCVAVGLRNNALRLHGWVYDIESGEIRTLDKNSKTYVSLAETRRCISSNSSTGARMLWTILPTLVLWTKNILVTNIKITAGVTTRFSHIHTTLRQVSFPESQTAVHTWCSDKKEQVRMQAKIKRIMNMLFYHESWDIMLIKDNGTHLFPDNTLEILSKSTAQQLKRNIHFRPILF
jgi:hypothetical protein